jgi:ATP-dependent DNA ligase
VQLYAFDALALDGEDLRALPLHLRKNNLARLLARRPDGIFISSSNRVRSARTCFGRRASSASRVWCPSIATAAIAPARRRTGSRSRTRSTRR